MTCAETPLPLSSLTSTDHMKQTLCYCAYPCTVKLARNGPARDLNLFFPVAGTFRLIQVLVVWLLETHSRGRGSFTLKTSFRYVQFPC